MKAATVTMLLIVLYPLTPPPSTLAPPSPPSQSTSGFELYLCFSPLATKSLAMSAVTKLLKWIRKEEDRLFILNSLIY